MGVILCIDPGTRGAGAALYDGPSKTLIGARYIRNPIDGGRRMDAAVALARAVEHWVTVVKMQAPSTVACEVMRSYSADQQKGPQDDLIDVSLVSMACAAIYQPTPKLVTYYPREWKGTLNAETCLERIVERLTKTGEHKRIELVGRLPLERVPHSDSLDHNTLDACGIGLFLLGRFAPMRVFPRE